MIVKSFTHNLFGEIRTMIDDNGAPWFVANDITSALNYKQCNILLRKYVDDEDIGSIILHDFSKPDEKLAVINIAGFFSIILGTKRKIAKKLKRWMAMEVLNQMKSINPTLNNRIKKLTQEDMTENGKKILGHSVAVANAKSLDCITASNLARKFGMDVYAFNKLLKSMNIQYRSDGRWHICKKYERLGLTQDRIYIGFSKDGEYREHSYMTWTPAGVKFLEKTLNIK